MVALYAAVRLKAAKEADIQALEEQIAALKATMKGGYKGSTIPTMIENLQKKLDRLRGL